jgi:septal ring factor EnvC (AmiA/AmiB activator)
MEFIQLLTAAGTPSALAVGAVYLLMKKDLKNVRQDVAELKQEVRHCKEERCRVESVLHDRITENAKITERLRGRMNGHSEVRA